MITDFENIYIDGDNEVNLNFLLDLTNQFTNKVWPTLGWLSKKNLYKKVKLNSHFNKKISFSELGLQPRERIISKFRIRLEGISSPIRQDYVITPFLTEITWLLKNVFIEASKNINLAELYEIFHASYEDQITRYRERNYKPEIINYLPTPIVHIVKVKAAELAAKERSNELVLAKAFTENIIASMLEMLIVLNHEGVIIEINKSVTQQLEYDEKALIGQHIRFLLDEENDEDLKYLIQFGISIPVEKVFKSKKGNKIPVSFSGSIMRTEKGRIEGVVCVAQDISKRKEQEKVIVEQNETLIKSNEAMDSFVYRVSHDLQSPIISMLSMVKMLKSRIDLDNNTTVKIFDNIEVLGARFQQTVKDMLDVARVEKSLETLIELVSLPKIMEEVKQDISSLIDKNKATIEVDFSKIDTITFTAINLKSILLNTVGNAIKYCSPDRLPVVKVYTVKDKDMICLIVQDNGIGINLEKHGKNLFGMFKRFHGHVKGTGVGLYIVKRTIESGGGIIDLQSEEGVGTTIRMWFKV